MSRLTQIAAITASNLKSLPHRLGSSLVIVTGIAGVVGVLVATMAMAIGFDQAMGSTGKANRLIVLAESSGQEARSNLPRESVSSILAAPGIAQDAAGHAIVSAEVITTIRHDLASGKRTNVALRGVGPNGFALRPEIRITQGRAFEPGKSELIVGKALTQRSGLTIGSKVRLRGAAWDIVGTFESGGDSRQSELLGDADTLLSALDRNLFQSVTVRVDSEADAAAFKDALTTNPTLKVAILPEMQYYKERSDDFGSALYLIGWVVGSIMGVGALFGALNTMYAAVATRSREIATLRAIGFDAAAVVASIFLEALLLALAGGMIGAAIAGLVFNGNSISTLTSGNAADPQMTFDMTVSPALLALGIAWAAGIGLLGGLFPAVRAARAPIATALRAV